MTTPFIVQSYPGDMGSRRATNLSGLSSGKTTLIYIQCNQTKVIWVLGGGQYNRKNSGIDSLAVERWTHYYGKLIEISITVRYCFKNELLT